MGFTEKWIGKSISQGISAEDLQSFVEKQLEENLSLEYKSMKTLKEPQALRKSISAFANSGGGLIIIGISEKKEGNKHLPGHLEWSHNPSWSKEWLQDVTLNQIRPPIQGVEILAVHDASTGTLFIVDVPASPNPPHMADRMYYFRHAAESLPMEHYQVADSFGKRQRPILKPMITLSHFDSRNDIVELTYSVSNSGHSLAKWIMAYLTFNLCTKLESTDDVMWQNLRQEQSANGSELWTVAYESPLMVLHPGMVKHLGKVKVHIGSPITLVSVTVGAEGATTDSYLTIISKEWLLDQAKRPDYRADGKQHIPTLACGPNFSFDELEKFREFAEPLNKDLKKLSKEQTTIILGAAISRIGNDAILTIVQTLEAILKSEEANPSEDKS